MSRPPKYRQVNFIPGVTYFKPAGIPLRVLDEICLSIEEAEAIRLKDLEGMDQERCAKKMNISRPTFQRVLESARNKVAEALLSGKAIRIEGGNFEMAPLHFICPTGHEWEIPFEEAMKSGQQPCPVCSTLVVVPLQQSAFGWGRGRRGRKYGEEVQRRGRTTRVTE